MNYKERETKISLKFLNLSIPKVVEAWHICSLKKNTENSPDKLMHRNIFSDFIKELELYGSSTFIDNHDD